MQPVLSDPIPCFKALVTIHKLLVNGPHVVLSEACNEVAFLEQCARIHGSQNGAFASSYGYGPLISSYVSFLLTKIDFHRTHPEFTGNFDYEEYLSIKGVQDLDEGYKTIDEMMELQERLDLFQKSVFENFGGVSGSVECRISAFVPLIDESYGMYKFVTSMLSAMHLSVESPDPLILLVERYNAIFGSLKQFYEECSKIRYLTSLVAIPKLPERAPQFTEEALKRFTGSQAFHKAVESKSAPSSEEPKRGGQTTVVVQIPVQQPSQPAPIQQPQPQMLQPFMPVPGMFDAGLMSRVNTEIVQMQSSLQAATAQHHQDQAALNDLRERFEKAELRAKELTQRYNQLASQANTQGEDLREQIAAWKRKYEATAKLYTELRDRYMQLAEKLNESSKTAQYSRSLEGRLQELELLRMTEQQMNSEKDAKLAELEERCRQLQGECEALRIEECVIGGEIGGQLADELAKAAAEIATAASKLTELRGMEGLKCHEDLLDAASALTSAISDLVKYARSVQEAIVAEASSSGDADIMAASFYKKNSVWTAGLISAAQAVAGATSHLVETADALLRTKSRSPEHLIVASTGVTASTAQLMAAARVKANPMWPCSEALESAARSVSEANKALVSLVTSKAALYDGSGADGSHGDLPTTLQGFKIAEMDQQVEILALERKLQSARMHLARLRQSQYTVSNNSTEADVNEHQQFSNESVDTFTTSATEDEDNALPSNDDWLLTIPPKLEELKF